MVKRQFERLVVALTAWLQERYGYRSTKIYGTFPPHVKTTFKR